MACHNYAGRNDGEASPHLLGSGLRWAFRYGAFCVVRYKEQTEAPRSDRWIEEELFFWRLIA